MATRSKFLSAREPVAVVILAAGKGKRMKSETPKVLCATEEQPLLGHVLDTVAELAPEKLVVITGHGADAVENFTRSHNISSSQQSNLSFALQKEQRGTADAVKATADNLKGFVGTVLILYGDVPLVEASTLANLLVRHEESKATVSLITCLVHEDNRYGRIIRDSSGEIAKIVEAADCTANEDRICEFNTGIYAVDSAFLYPALDKIVAENVQGEFYLTDIIEIAVKEGQRVSTLTVRGDAEVQGVNSPVELARINSCLLSARVSRLIEAGVTITDPSSLYLGPKVTVAAGAVIGPQVQLLGATAIESGVTIEGCAWISDCQVQSGASIKFGVRCEKAIIGSNSMVGPFAHLRPKAVLGSDVKIGNFVEVKNTKLDDGAKASHLTYLGDATVGKDANIGAGTITCNYDGYKKSHTEIGEGVFVGSNSCLVAPVNIGAGASIGAGSVITKNIEPDALAFTRPPLVTKSGWAARKRGKL